MLIKCHLLVHKNYDRIQHKFMIINNNRGNVSQHNKSHPSMTSPKLTSYAMVKSLEVFPPRSRIKQGCLLSQLLFNIVNSDRNN